MKEEEEGFSLWGREFFLTRGEGGILDRLEIRGPRRRRRRRSIIIGTMCVCVGRILRNPSLTAASFLKTQPCQAPRRRPCRAREALEILGGDRKNPAVG